MVDDELDVDEPWVIPLHGAIAPALDPIARTFDPVEDPVTTAHLYDDDELPTIEFRPRLRRSA